MDLLTGLVTRTLCTLQGLCTCRFRRRAALRKLLELQEDVLYPSFSVQARTNPSPSSRPIQSTSSKQHSRQQMYGQAEPTVARLLLESWQIMGDLIILELVENALGTYGKALEIAWWHWM